MTFDFCIGCGADYLVFPTKAAIVDIAEEGCPHCGGLEFKTMTAEEGCNWRHLQWPKQWPIGWMFNKIKIEEPA